MGGPSVKGRRKEGARGGHSLNFMGTGPSPHRHFLLLYSPSWSRRRPSPERLCDLPKVTQPGSGRAGVLPPQL